MGLLKFLNFDAQNMGQRVQPRDVITDPRAYAQQQLASAQAAPPPVLPQGPALNMPKPGRFASVFDMNAAPGMGDLMLMGPGYVQKKIAYQNPGAPEPMKVGQNDRIVQQQGDGSYRSLYEPPPAVAPPRIFNTGQSIVSVGPDNQPNVLYTDPKQPSQGRGTYEILTKDEVAALGLPPGSYKRNSVTQDIVPVGRQKAQYTEFAGKSAQFANRTLASHKTLAALEEKLTSPTGVFMAQSGFGTEDERKVRQAQREFVNAILRQESGAAIGKDEFASAALQYFPQPGDTKAVVEQKRQARMRAVQGLINASQGAYEEWYGEPADAPAGGDPGAPKRIKLD